MNKNKGFTITELLAVITILGLLFAFVVPSVSRLFSKTKDEQYELMVTTIENAARNYINDNSELFYGSDTDNTLIKKVRNNNSCLITSVSLNTLISNNYLKNNIIDPKTNTEFNTDLVVDVYNNDNIKEFIFNSGNNEYKPCFYAKETEENYLWYSGFLWRILGVTEDNTIKIVLNDTLSISNYASTNTTLYRNSYINNYLTDYFYPMLNSTNLLATSSYCQDTRNSSDSKTFDCSNTYNAKIGLLTLDEYNYISSDSVSFLNNNTNFYTMTPSSSSNVYMIASDGTINNKSVNTFLGIRPTLTLKTDTEIIKGNGEYNNPYILNEDNNIAVSTKISTRHVGEYLNINNNIYRIVEATDEYVKIVLNSFYKKPGRVDGYYSFSLSNNNMISLNSTDNIGYILNNDIYNDLFNTNNLKDITMKTNYPIGTPIDNNLDVFTTTLNNINSVYMNVSLLRIGDILSGSNASLTITQATDNEIITVYDGKDITPITTTDIQKVYPVISIKPDNIIKSGTGTYLDPYLLQI